MLAKNWWNVRGGFSLNFWAERLGREGGGRKRNNTVWEGSEGLRKERGDYQGLWPGGG